MPDENIRALIDDLAAPGGGLDLDDTDLLDDEPGAVEGDDALIQDLLAELEKFDIILPPDTRPDNFLERLQVGLKTAAAHQAIEDEPLGNVSDTETTVADSGGVAMMSLQVKGVLGYAERQHRDAVEATLESLLKSGRCTPAEFHDRKASVPSLRLSLDETGNAEPSDLEKWIASRQPLPRGTFWEPDEKALRLGAETEEPPAELMGRESDSKVNAVLAAVFGPKK
jgi:hypothetical protein